MDSSTYRRLVWKMLAVVDFMKTGFHNKTASNVVLKSRHVVSACKRGLWSHNIFIGPEYLRRGGVHWVCLITHEINVQRVSVISRHHFPPSNWVILLAYKTTSPCTTSIVQELTGSPFCPTKWSRFDFNSSSVGGKKEALLYSMANGCSSLRVLSSKNERLILSQKYENWAAKKC